MRDTVKKILLLIVLIAVVIIAVWFWFTQEKSQAADYLVNGNGRIEATEIDIATKYAGRVIAIYANEGDFIEAGDIVASMQIDVLNAQLNEARAELQKAMNAVASAQAQVAVQESEVAAAKALVVQRTSELENAQRRYNRTQSLTQKGSASRQQLDDDEAAVRSAQATLVAARAQVKAAEAAVISAQSQVNGAQSAVTAVEATIERIEVDIADSQLKAPRDGRVQYRVAEPGEVLASGGKVINMVDLTDVYMTFFLPETVVGQVALGSDARIVLDTFPDYVIPAKVSYISSVAQFTPKTVETAEERQKLMFRVKVRIPPDLLAKHIRQVKTGLPGVAWLKLAPEASWPASLQINVPE
ncbi:HlyD family secretion protein [Methylophaga sp.]|uniref:HlyD family secretion protein n=1 Tax=Methylophaga sp. TaxID=2024840 RepID=UPI003F69CEF9